MSYTIEVTDTTPVNVESTGSTDFFVYGHAFLSITRRGYEDACIKMETFGTSGFTLKAASLVKIKSASEKGFTVHVKKSEGNVAFYISEGPSHIHGEVEGFYDGINSLKRKQAEANLKRLI